MLQEMINKASNDSLSEQVGMVYQVWDEGEITLQKSGDLLWDRSLHYMKPAIKVIEGINWPHVSGSHGYAFVDRDDAESIRERIRREAIIEIEMMP